MIVMFSKYRLLILFCLLLFAISLHAADPDPSIKFIPNKNQWRSDINYVARINNSIRKGFRYNAW